MHYGTANQRSFRFSFCQISFPPLVPPLPSPVFCPRTAKTRSGDEINKKAQCRSRAWAPQKFELNSQHVRNSLNKFKLLLIKYFTFTVQVHFKLRWLEIVFEIFFTRKQFTFIYIITAFMVATRLSNKCTFPSHFIFDTLES